MRTPRKLMSASLAALLLMSLTLSLFSYAAVPPVPMTVWGYVYIDTDGVLELAPADMNVYAKYDGAVIAECQTTAEGKYALSIEGPDEGASIDLWVEDQNLETVILEYMSDPIILDLTYTVVIPDTGILSISTTPVDGEVFVAGVSWGTAPAPREVEVGLYAVTFGDMVGYTKPDAVEATVLVGETKVVLGTYVLIPVVPQLVITYTPVTVYENNEVTITVKADEAPIADVSVTIVNPAEDIIFIEVTNELGICTFIADTAGDWTIHTVKDGYTDAGITIEVLEYVPPVLPQLVITYTPDTVIENDEVTVTIKAEEAPIADVGVWVINPSEEWSYKSTDDLGQFTFTPDEDGNWTISASKMDYMYAEITIEVLEYVPPVLPQLVITYTPAIVYVNDKVTVTVKAEEAPIAEAEVVILNPALDIALLKITDDLGKCNFTADEVGVWFVGSEKDGYIYADITLEVLLPPVENGTLSITTTPVSAEVSVDGDFWGVTPVSQVVAVGEYTVSFAPVTGYSTPAPKVAKVTVGAIINVTGTYVKTVVENGTLSITTTPVKGEVFVNEEPWGTAPQSKVVDVGIYTVTFGDVDGHTKPSLISATVIANATTDVKGTYTRVFTSDFSIDYVSATTVDYGDVLTVKGSGVTAGTEVKVFWDYASGKYVHLLNTTEGKPDGKFECEVKVPSDYVGDHYLWATDTSTGETIRYGPLTMVPLLKLSPSSGLVGDDITIKGYGFTEEANFTSITFAGVPITTEPEKVETDEDGYFTYTFEIAKGTIYGEYKVKAVDFYGFTDSADFTLGASITLDPDEGPTGTVVEVEGRGWTPTATISFTIDGNPVQVVDDDVVTVKSAGTFSADIVIPDMSSVGDYDIEATESGGVKGPADEEFEVTGLPKIKLSPGFGPPGAMIDITGYNFTQIRDTEVELDFGSLVGVKTFKTDSKGEFSGTFQAQALAFSPPDHKVLATDEYGLADDANFRLGMMVVIISPISGPSGDHVYLTGTGFDPNGDWNATLGGELIAEGKATADGTISDYFYAPTLDVGLYDIAILDIESEIELSTPFTVTDTTRVTLDPADAPNEYNLTIKGYNFADTVGDVEFVLYNATEDWDMEVYQTIDGEVDDVMTDVDGNFTAWWIVLDDDTISIGDYTINATGSEGLFAQVTFSLAAEVVDVQPRKPLFNRGDVIQFDVSNDFKYPDAYIKIWDPNENLYWKTEVLGWLKVTGLYTIPYYMQTSGGNPMLLAPDAPLGTWTWTFYKSGTKNISDGTFDVGPSPSALLTGQLDILSGELTALTDAFEDVTDDIGDLADDFADRIADVEDMIDDIADDVASELADEIAAATDAGKEASEAVSDLEEAMSDIAESTAELAEKIAAATDAAQDASDAAEDAQKNTKGLTGLVYGAIGASLIAALAAVISLMQISKKIA